MLSINTQNNTVLQCVTGKTFTCTYKKSTDLHGALQLHMQFYDKISRSQRASHGNWHARYSLHACSIATNASMCQEKFARGLGMCVFLLSVIVLPHDLKSLTCFLTGFACAVYDTLMCNFAACSQLQSVLGYSRSDIVVGRIHLFACAYLYYPTTRLHLYFSTIFEAHLCVYTYDGM